MSYRLILTREAEQDLHRIETHIAKVSYPATAVRYMARVTAALRRLTLAPFQGTRREDLGIGIRSTGFERRITILFAVRDLEVVIISVLFGGRQKRRTPKQPG